MFDINVLNRLSYHLCVESNEQIRREAEDTLNKILESNECLRSCLLLLEQGDPPYATIVATSSLRRLLSKKIGITFQERVDLNQYLLMYMVKHVTTIEKYALNCLCKVFALLTKIGWLDRNNDDALTFQESIPNLLNAGKEKTDNGFLALKLLTALVEEANSEEGFDSISKQRKVASDLRDGILLDIFNLSLDILQESLTQQQSDAIAQKCVLQALDLSLACVNYDFIGTINDDTLDENVNIQVPTKWRPVLIDRDVVKLFFDLYLSLPTEHVGKAFQVVVQLTSVRRMLFDSSDRQKYVESIINGLKSVFEHSEKLDEPDNFHHLCRLISRLKANYQVAELTKCTNFSSLLDMLAQFTVQSLCTIDVLTTNSVYYLMSFWSRMAGSLNYARVDVNPINAYIPQICSIFIDSRILLADAVVRDNREDQLDDATSLRQTMDLFANICRQSYKEAAKKLADHFDENMQHLVNANTAEQKAVAQKRIIWIITTMAAGLPGKSTPRASSDEDEAVDGELVSRVWCLMRETDKQLGGMPSHADIQLERSYLFFMEEFRKAYITDKMHSSSSRVYEKLGQLLGIQNDHDVVSFFVRKIQTNLKFWCKSELVLTMTLKLLNDLMIGCSNINRLFKLDEMQHILRNHNEFEFVSTCTNVNVLRTRTSYYAALFRLLNSELESQPAIFKTFMQPLADQFAKLLESFKTGNYSSDDVRYRIIGLCRDLRGISSSCSNNFNYNMLITWMLPDVFTVLHCAVQFWVGDADVTTPVLKLLAELVHNRQSRLSYRMDSCVPVVLFREVSKIICDYGNSFLNLPEVSKDSFYKQRIKNFGVLCSILRHVLSGHYLPFGTFWLYGDRCMKDAIDVVFKIFMRIHDQGLLDYTKISLDIYYWLEALTKEYIAYVSNADKEIVLIIMKTAHYGILSVDTPITTASCTILERILDYLFERLSEDTNQQIREPDNNNCINAIKENPDVLENTFSVILNQLLFTRQNCVWSLSRLLLGLIIACEDFYNKWRMDFIMQQSDAVRPALEEAFTKFMENVKKDYSAKNREQFMTTVTVLRKNIEQILKGTSTGAPDTEYADNQFMTE